jgi:5'-3' exonuclease
MQALIDGDIVVYRSAFAAEHTYYFLYDTTQGESPADWPLIDKFESAKDLKSYISEHELTDYATSKEREVEPVENVLYSIKHTLNSIKKAVKADSIRVFLSKGECFRHKKATIAEYKGNRKDTPRPVHYEAAREYLLNYHNAEVFTTIEADDALALYQTDTTCICSIDKDLLQIEGKHYNWVKNEKSLVKPRAALCRLWEQVLTGDGTDNIPGIRGIGPKTAKKLIADCAGKMEMRELCIKKWAEALADDKVKLFQLRDSGKVTPKEAMEEVYMLVKVGGKYAEEALNSDRAKALKESG